MIQRCHNKNSTAYPLYGARGIYVCDEWRHCRQSYIDFALKNGASMKLEVDRINNDKGYFPENIRYTTHQVNLHNRTRPRKGKKHNLPHGVYYYANNKSPYRVVFNRNGIYHSSGQSYTTLQDALAARDHLKKQLDGEI